MTAKEIKNKIELRTKNNSDLKQVPSLKNIYTFSLFYPVSERWLNFFNKNLDETRDNVRDKN